MGISEKTRPVAHTRSLMGIIGVLFQGFVWDKKWYRDSHYFKFDIGDTVLISKKNAFGYGLDSHGVVLDHIWDSGNGDQYVIEMNSYDRDSDAPSTRLDWFEWRTLMFKSLDMHSRKIKKETHFKSNIELHFKKGKHD
jgi:hypothetical protein